MERPTASQSTTGLHTQAVTTHSLAPPRLEIFSEHQQKIYRIPHELEDFPDELISQIFIAGCQYPDDPAYLFSRPGARRRKEFANIARAVCSRWRELIDSRPLQTEIWILYTFLHFGDEGISAVNVARFKCDMARSQGADLALRFTHETYHRPLPREAMITKLFAHGMSLISIYQEQIFALDFCISGNRLLQHCFELLLIHVRPAPRLSFIAFPNHQMDKSPYMVLNSPPIHGFEKVLPVRANHSLEEPQLFESLVYLQVPSPEWLSHFKSSLHFHLTITAIRDDDESHDFSTAHLTSLDLTGEFPGAEGFSFPSLRNLAIDMDRKSAVHLLTKMALPAVKQARIVISGHENPYFTEPTRAEPHFRFLTNLSISFPRNILELNVLELFKQAPLIRLDLNEYPIPIHREPRAVDHQGDYDQTFNQILLSTHGQWKLQELRCCLPLFAEGLLPPILDCLDLEQLSNLYISLTPGTHPIPRIGNNRENLDGLLPLQQLKQLTLLNFPNAMTISLLNRLQPESLQILVISEQPSSQYMDIGLPAPDYLYREENMDQPTMRSVQDLQYTYLEDPIFLPFLLKLTPNLQRLSIHFNCSHYSMPKLKDLPLADNVGADRLHDAHNTDDISSQNIPLAGSTFASTFDIAEWLVPSQEGKVPLQNLQNLHIRGVEEDSMSLNAIQKDASRWNGIFQARSDAGIPPLAIKVTPAKENDPPFYWSSKNSD